jgi:hypothetical protein
MLSTIPSPALSSRATILVFISASVVRFPRGTGTASLRGGRLSNGIRKTFRFPVAMSDEGGRVSGMKKNDLARRLREALKTRRVVEVAAACQVDERTVRNWRDGRLPNSPAIRANLVTYLDRINGGSR